MNLLSKHYCVKKLQDINLAMMNWQYIAQKSYVFSGI